MIDRRTFLFGGAAAALAGRALAQAPAHRETLTDWLRASPEQRTLALKAVLDRIQTMDSSIHAWVQVAPERSSVDGPLANIPFGAKDIIETKGLSTEYGSPIYKGRIGTSDAAIVQKLRSRGAVLLGKTHSTAFAYRTPAPTRNPHALDHTPGGSSSGSAAAVAAGMCPVAIGTQTGGSMLRPASFCGVTGFKPTYGLLPMEGVLPFAKSLDTLGFFTHHPDDMLALWNALGFPIGEAEEVPLAVVDPLPPVEPEMAEAFKRTLSSLRRRNVSIRPVDIGGMLDTLIADARTVMFYEGARFHEARYKEYGDRLQDMAVLVREGLTISAAKYDAARRSIAECRTRVAGIYKTTPIILVPAAPGPAPRGLDSTGDSRMNAPWTALGTPAMSLPMPVAGALPLGLQLTGAQGADARVIRTAVRLHHIMSGDR